MATKKSTKHAVLQSIGESPDLLILFIPDGTPPSDEGVLVTDIYSMCGGNVCSMPYKKITH